MAAEGERARFKGRAKKHRMLREDEECLLQSDLPSSGTILEDESLWTVPPSPERDLRQLIADLRSHQENLFRQVLHKQKELQTQLLVMHSASKEAADAQAVVSLRQEDLRAELRDFCCKFPGADTSQCAVKTHQHVTELGQMMTGLGEFGTAGAVGKNGELSIDASTEPSSNAPPGDAQFSFEPVLPSSPTSVLDSQQMSGSLSTSLKSQASQNWKKAMDKYAQSETGKSGESLRTIKRLGSRTSLHIQPQVFQGGCCPSCGSRRAQVISLMRTKSFEIALVFAIMGNAFVMCWESQYVGLDVGFALQFPGRPTQANVVWPGAATTFNALDWFFGTLFTSEMVVKILCLRCNYFYDWAGLNRRSHDLMLRNFLRRLQSWNLLDFVCVLAFLFDKMAGGSGSVNPQLLRLLRLFRLFRLIRLLRFLETLDHLYVMTTAIAGLSRVLAWAIVLLTTMLLTCNLFLVQILQATYFNEITVNDLTEEQLRKHHEMYAYFGTCSRCMLSMFEITLGNWPPVARLLSEEVSEWFTFICVAHKLTIGFAVIGVINAVILQETFKVAETDDIILFRQKKQASIVLRKKMERLFRMLEKSGDGKLDIDEFEALGEDPEIKIWLSSLDVESDCLRTLFDLIDVNGDGNVTLDELVMRMPRIKGAARSVDVMSLKKKVENHLKL